MWKFYIQFPATTECTYLVHTIKAKLAFLSTNHWINLIQSMNQTVQWIKTKLLLLLSLKRRWTALDWKMFRNFHDLNYYSKNSFEKTISPLLKKTSKLKRSVCPPLAFNLIWVNLQSQLDLDTEVKNSYSTLKQGIWCWVKGRLYYFWVFRLAVFGVWFKNKFL